MSKVSKQQVVEEFAQIICEAVDIIGQSRTRWGTNDVALIAFVNDDGTAEIRSAIRSEALAGIRVLFEDVAPELIEWLSQERPPTICPLVIFDYRGDSNDPTPVYWMRLKVEGTLGVLN